MVNFGINGCDVVVEILVLRLFFTPESGAAGRWCPGKHLGLFCRKKNINFISRTKRRTPKNTNVRDQRVHLNYVICWEVEQ